MKKEKVTCVVCKLRNMFEEIKDELCFDIGLFPKFCPDPIEVVNTRDELQVCVECGYVAKYLREDLGIKKSMLKTDKYKYPFGKLTETERVLRNYQAGIIYSNSRCQRSAAEFYIRAGVLAVSLEIREDCFRKAWLCMKNILDVNHVLANFEYYLAYLNMMRLLKMFDAVKDSVEAHKDEYCDLEKSLLLKMYQLSEEKNAKYMTYVEMLSKKQTE